MGTGCAWGRIQLEESVWILAEILNSLFVCSRSKWGGRGCRRVIWSRTFTPSRSTPTSLTAMHGLTWPPELSMQIQRKLKKSLSEWFYQKLPSSPNSLCMSCEVIFSIRSFSVCLTTYSQGKNGRDKNMLNNVNFWLFREIDGTPYEAYVKEKEEAKRVYNQAQSQGQSAGLVELK